MGKLRDEAESLGIEVDGRWSNGTLQRRIAERKAMADEEAKRETVPETTVVVRLTKHHKPAGWYEVLGHYDADNRFVRGEPKEPPYPGVNSAHKLWADTVVKLPAEEAKRLVQNVAELTVTDRDPETKRPIGKRILKTRKPLAEVEVDWGKVSAVGFDVEDAA